MTYTLYVFLKVPKNALFCEIAKNHNLLYSSELNDYNILWFS